MLGAQHVLRNRHGGTADRADPTVDHQRVVEPRRTLELDRAAMDRELDAVLGEQVTVADAGQAHHLGARALGEFEIRGVIDDAAGIRVLVVDADREQMALAVEAAGDRAIGDHAVSHRYPPPRPADRAGARGRAAPAGRDGASRWAPACGRAACAAPGPAGSGTAR